MGGLLQQYTAAGCRELRRVRIIALVPLDGDGSRSYKSESSPDGWISMSCLSKDTTCRTDCRALYGVSVHSTRRMVPEPCWA